MPKELEERLRRSARKRGLKPGSPRYNAYTYGTLRKIEERRKKDDNGRRKQSR